MSRRMEKRSKPATLRGYQVRAMVGEEVYDRLARKELDAPWQQDAQNRADGELDPRARWDAAKWQELNIQPPQPNENGPGPLPPTFGEAKSVWRALRRVLSTPRLRTPRPRRRPDLKGLTAFANVWPLGLRKRIRALAGDYDADIRDLHKRHRYRMARWNKWLAWGHAWWYVLRGPADAIMTWAVKAWRGL